MQDNPIRKGVILVNLGSPVAPEPGAVRAFLGQFLSDPRVVELPRLFWLPLLHGVILPLRSRRVAHLYEAIWTSEGSPLTVTTRKQAAALQALLPDCQVTYAMTYGEPSIAQAVEGLRQQGVESILVLPLYPQYSATTTGAVYDQLARLVRQSRFVPDVHTVRHYCMRPDYVRALAESIREYRERHPGGQLLLFSFHGIPVRCVELGDPYEQHCRQTAAAVARELSLQDNQWEICFQSRFGKAEWLQPYTDAVLASLPSRGIHAVDVVCPAFAADCLETLEEIEVGSRSIFMEAGGRQFGRIPCLNDSAAHVEVLAAIAREALQGA